MFDGFGNVEVLVSPKFQDQAGAFVEVSVKLTVNPKLLELNPATAGKQEEAATATESHKVSALQALDAMRHT